MPTKPVVKADSLMRYIVRLQQQPLAVASAGSRGSLMNEHDRFKRDFASVTSRATARTSSQRPALLAEYTTAFNGFCVLATQQAADDLRKLPYITAITEDKQVKTSDVSSNNLIGAPDVWAQLGFTGEGITIGIIDTGIDYTHSDLGSGFGNGFKVAGGYDFVNEDTDPMDDHGHGTHVAGIAAGNGAGLKGVAPDATLIAYKVLTAEGWGYDSWILAAVERSVDPDQNPATDDHLDVVNMSLGRYADESEPMSEAVNNAVAAGVVFAVAAGNSGYNGMQTVGTPGIAEHAITVAATDINDLITGFSSRGPSIRTFAMKPDIAAPGDNIYSSVLGNSYANYSGTSMASPHVAGAAALLLEKNPSWSPETVKALLMEYANQTPGTYAERGSGRLNVLNAAKASFVLTPASISLGIPDSTSNNIVRNFSITLKNLSAQSKTYDLSLQGSFALAAFQGTLSASSVTVPASSEASITLSVNIDVSALPTLNLPEMYIGQVRAQSGDEVVNVPVGLANPKIITVELSYPLPYFLLVMSAESNYFNVLQPTSTIVQLPLASGNYDMVATYYDLHYVIEEGISTETTGAVSLQSQRANRYLAFDARSVNNEPLQIDYGFGVTGLSMQDGAFGMLVATFASFDTVYVNDASERFQMDFLFSGMAYGTNQHYDIAQSQRGFNGNKALTNTPGDLIPSRFQYNSPNNDASEVYALFSYGFANSFTFSTWTTYPHYSAPGLTFYNTRINQQSKVLYTQHDVDPYQSSHFTYQTPAFSIHENDSISYHEPFFGGLLYHEQGVENSSREKLGDTMLRFTPASYNVDNVIYLTTPNYLLPGFFRRAKGDHEVGNVHFTLKQDGAVIRDETFKDPTLQAGVYQYWENMPAGVYEATYQMNEYQEQGRFGEARGTLRFNTGQDDKNAPFLSRFELWSNNKMTNVVSPGQPAHLVINAYDNCDRWGCPDWRATVDTVLVWYKKTSSDTWHTLALDEQQNVPLPLNLTEGHYSLKLNIVDFAGNALLYELNPGFAVGPQSGIPYEKPGLISPENHTDVSRKPYFWFTALDSATHYTVELWADSALQELIRSFETVEHQFEYDDTLSRNTVYFWRVRAHFEAGMSPWSDVSQFRVKGESTLILVSPANGSTPTSYNLDFHFSDPAGLRDYYYAEISTTPDFQTQKQFQIVWGSPFQFYTPLDGGTTYYWRMMRPYPSLEEWTDPFSFTTADTTLARVTLLSPENGATEVPGDATFQWTEVQGATKYFIQVAVSPAFESYTLTMNGWFTTPYATNIPLYQDSTHYWRVMALSDTGSSHWSETFQFTSGSTPLNLLTPENGATDQSQTIQLTWSKSAFAIYYNLQLSFSPNFDAQSIIEEIWTQYTEESRTLPYPGATIYWRVRAAGMELTPWTETYSFTLANDPAPIPYSPANEAIGVVSPVVFSWSEVQQAQNYNLEVSTSQQFDSTFLISRWYEDTSGEVELPYPGTTYYWRVRSSSANNVSAWSEVYRFTSYTPGEVQLLWPGNGATNVDYNTTFSWSGYPDADQYILQIGRATDFSDSTLVYNDWHNDTDVAVYLPYPGETLYWRVKAVTSTGVSNWSDVYSFSVQPQVVNLQLPGNQATQVTSPVTFVWSEVLDGELYHLEVSTTPTFHDSTLVADDWYAGGVAVVELPFPNHTLYWRVKAVTSTTVLPWSDVFYFTLQPEAFTVTLMSPVNGTTDVPHSATLTWNASSSAVEYFLQVATHPDFYDSTLVENSWHTTTSATVDLPYPGEVLFWRVKALSQTAASPWSEPFHFFVQDVSFNQMHPSANAIVSADSALTFSWQCSPAGASYVWQLSEIESFDEFSQRTITSPATTVSSLKKETTYYWKVATTVGDYTLWSEVMSFTTAPEVITETESNLNEVITVHPNPAARLVTVNTPAAGFTLAVYNSMGQRVDYTGYAQEVEVRNVEHLPTGVYTIVLTHNGAVVQKRLVVNR